MKRILGLILTAVFLSALSIPCGAADTEATTYREYPGFADVAEESAAYEAIKLCYERGLMNGASETAFNPQGKLTIAQLVVLAARLHDLLSGGDGIVPGLPDYGAPYLRFYDEDGNKIVFFTIEEIPAFNAGENPYIGAANETGGSELPETCRLEIGFEGYNHVKTFRGTKESHGNAGGTMHEGFVGTGYRFTDPGAASFSKFYAFPTSYEKAWWYPAAFYLASEGVLSFDGELVYRAIIENNGDDSYDPLARFSKDNATRSLFAWLVDLTAGPLESVNETASAPDVTEETQDSEAILRLYQAGVLTGVDAAGNFNGSGELTRAQAAMMLARVLEPSLRVRAS